MEGSNPRTAEAAIRESEERLKLAVEGTGAGLWDWYPQTGEAAYNQRWAEIVGYTLDELQPVSAKTWVDLTHPDDMRRAREILDEHFAGRRDAYLCELRMKHKAGHWVWVLSQGKVAERDADGRPLRMTGTHIDITDHKQAVDALRESEERFRIVLEALPYGVLAHDAEGRIRLFNDKVCEYTGYTRDELLRMAISDIDSQTAQSEFRENVLSKIQNGGSVTFEAMNRRKDGSFFPVEVTLSSIVIQNERLILGASMDIAERKKAEAALRESEERFRIVIENLPCAVIVHDVDGRIRIVNKMACGFAGYSADELVRMNVADCALDSGKERRERIWKDLKHGEAVQIESVLRRKDGSEFLAEVRVSAFSLGKERVLLAIVQDITERRQVETALRESEEWFRVAAENLPLGFFVHDVNGRFKMVNKIACEYLGYARDELLGMSVADIDLWAEDLSYRQNIWQTLERGGSVRIESMQRRKNGTIYPVEVTISAVTLHGERMFLAVVQDVTERRQAEEERELFISRLEAQNTELERFTYTVSHDLKSPLITITGYLGLLRDDLSKGNVKAVEDDAARIDAAAGRMQKLLEDLLNLSRIGRQVNPPQDVELLGLVREVLDQLAGPLAQHEPPIQVDVAPDLPLVRGDRHRLLEVFQNLVENAIKYMGEQADPRVEIGVRYETARTVFFVRDNGIGIEPCYHQKIFGLFDQLNPKAGGTGIGLALVRRIVEFHGGVIWVESEGLGHGATFCFTLPRNNSIEGVQEPGPNG